MTKEKVNKLCGYCANFYNASTGNSKLSEDGKSVYYKHCAIIDKEVDKNTKACDKFNLSKFLFCSKKKHGGLLYTSVCINRINTKVEGCMGCKKGKLLKSILEDKWV